MYKMVCSAYTLQIEDFVTAIREMDWANGALSLTEFPMLFEQIGVTPSGEPMWEYLGNWWDLHIGTITA